MVILIIIIVIAVLLFLLTRKTPKQKELDERIKKMHELPTYKAQNKTTQNNLVIPKYNSNYASPTEELNKYYVNTLDLNLQKNEKCYFYSQVNILKSKEIIEKYEHLNTGLSFSVGKGTRVRTGSGKTVPIRKNIVEKIPGKLYITNKRMMLISNKNSFSLRHDEIMQISNADLTTKSSFTIHSANGKNYEIEFPGVRKFDANNILKLVKESNEECKNIKG